MSLEPEISLASLVLVLALTLVYCITAILVGNYDEDSKGDEGDEATDDEDGVVLVKTESK